MLALADDVASLASSLLVLGLALLVLPSVRRDGQPARALMFASMAVLAWRYMAWRFAVTTADLEFSLEALVSWTFAILEAATILSSTTAFLILSRTRERTTEVEQHLGWWQAKGQARVDILIATYNEEAAILERTILGAIASSHPNTRVWVLDDGRRPWLDELSTQLGARYLARSDNHHAKAGNINAALAVLRALPDPPDFVSVLDADFVPHRNFVSRMLALFHDNRVGLVQSPQHFFNPDPIQHNLGIDRAYPDEQRFFFDHLQSSRDAWGIAFCCGTSSMMRWQALEAVGGFPTDSVTEDFLLTLRMAEAGWATVYLNEALTEGLAPEGLAEYVTQRGRWCLGLIQIIRGRSGPLARNTLRTRDRFSLVDAFLYWAATYPFRLACLVLPLFYWFLGVTAVNATVPDVLQYFLPYYLAVLIGLNWVSYGSVLPVLNDVNQLLGATEITKAVLIGLFRPANQKFKVTEKGGDRSRSFVQWQLFKPLALMFAANAAGLFFAIATDVVFDRDAGDGKAVILVWSFYNLVVLAASMFACIERPRTTLARRLAPEVIKLRTMSGHGGAGWLMRLTLSDAWVRGGPIVQVGTMLDVEVTEVGWLRATVLRVEASGFALGFAPDPGQRDRILLKLHTQPGAPGTLRSNVVRVMLGSVRRMLRSEG